MNWTQAKEQMKKGLSVHRKGLRGWYSMGGDKLQRSTWHIYPVACTTSYTEATVEMEKAKNWEIKL